MSSVVDVDRTCVHIIRAMLQRCRYQVTTCSRAMDALDILRANKGKFDLVLSDVHMPDMNGFRLLEHIGLEMDLPVIMMSSEDEYDLVLMGVKHGACDYLIKPVRIDALKNIWQHVVRKQRNESKLKEVEYSGGSEDNDHHNKSFDENTSTAIKRKREEEEEEKTEEREHMSTTKKQRVVWTCELHQQFVAAVEQLGVEKAVPKKILELMNNPTLTRENVASHLQKYRLYLKRLKATQQQESGEAFFSNVPNSPLNQLPPQALMNLGQRRPINICFDQRGFFSPNPSFASSSNLSPMMMQQVNNNQILQTYGNLGFQATQGFASLPTNSFVKHSRQFSHDSMISNGISDHVLLRTGPTMNRGQSFHGNYMNMQQYAAVPQALYNVQGSIAPHASTGMIQESMTEAQGDFEVATDIVNQDMISGNVGYGSIVSQDFNANLKEGAARSMRTFTKEIHIRAAYEEDGLLFDDDGLPDLISLWENKPGTDVLEPEVTY
ncbi:uncharacterized protein A4U43_C05F1410 [Asparagus officinalis]|uniref:Two-component response regulator n=1 Tax=Asparagus officinalis TaxID=4686 RepID=A0A5P1EU28_ASPOF|nr:two-component response regulator ARR2-like [Asparagus officinalis]ONK67570.1 uncharacterized protein A4U43_C05F1410 [Asparagus officinalis]